MATKWNQLFGEDYYITLSNQERKYLGLEALVEKWDLLQFYSKTNLWHKRTSIYFDDCKIVKVIVEEKKVVKDAIVYELIYEYDTSLETENRELLLPLTSKGKKKKLTPTNVLNIDPFGNSFSFVKKTDDHIFVEMQIKNYRNAQNIQMGEEDKIQKIRSEADFHQFMNDYINTCPKDYFEKIARLKKKNPIRKYQIGDIFRVELDRFHYAYGLITGKVQEILQWDELPENHSLRNLMRVPIMIRFYQIYTINPDLSVIELQEYPLGRVQICADNDIYYGTHPIVGHKELVEEDIEFNLVCNKIMDTPSTKGLFVYEQYLDMTRKKQIQDYSLYVEWGLASMILTNDKISEQLKTYLLEYTTPHKGILTNIYPSNYPKEDYIEKNNLLNKENEYIKEELFRCLDIDPNTTFDQFAIQYHGLTKKQIVEKLK